MSWQTSGAVGHSLNMSAKCRTQERTRHVKNTVRGCLIQGTGRRVSQSYRRRSYLQNTWRDTIFILKKEAVRATGRAVARRSAAVYAGTTGEDSNAEELRVLVLGGTGRVGTAAAIHLLKACPASLPLHVVLAGRSAEKGEAALEEVSQAVGASTELYDSCHRVSFLEMDFKEAPQLSAALQGAAGVIHTAGPYLNEYPVVLKAAVDAGVACYVDVADPVEYLDEALTYTAAAEEAGTMALLCSGAFPGLSNVIAMECAEILAPQQIKDVKFNYFTAGLGGSGKVNLAITNFGFGEEVMTYRQGKLKAQLQAGLQSEKVDFFIDKEDASFERVGSREVWMWPFPEVLTVARKLRIRGDSDVKMGTAPAAWNVILGALVTLVPRSWWKSDAFSNGLADFSWPMVLFTDKFVGETHAIRVDVTAESGDAAVAVHGHASFRTIVGQSAAEFCLNLLARKNAVSLTPTAPQPQAWRPGVFLPEELFDRADQREPLLRRIANAEGTFTFRVEGFESTDAAPSAAVVRKMEVVSSNNVVEIPSDVIDAPTEGAEDTMRTAGGGKSNAEGNDVVKQLQSQLREQLPSTSSASESVVRQLSDQLDDRLWKETVEKIPVNTSYLEAKEALDEKLKRDRSIQRAALTIVVATPLIYIVANLLLFIVNS
ncbi:hypothetical protein CYMTET_32187 [Cymbomonas tetramitiformis]|uniref:Saccharopine dehydrogenase NADP binding domain-containing protein n=1 Tax=Cymbomonas tetramitiformis TaxID=36881 RepID=A0AAE0KSG4_9CHLO|nr:hypothetical protein CYMTET_32187 [Cymbomonas tetramitiformis]